jgi:uncharacterized protein YciI
MARPDCRERSHDRAITEAKQMFMVRRRHVANVGEVVVGQEQAHEDHISAYSKTIASGRILNEDGSMAGVFAISGHETWDDIRYYVYEDPFTKAGAYAEIEIKELDLYLLDAGYARAPEWFLDRHPDLAPRFTPVARAGRR